MRKITEIIVHCSATGEGKDFHAADIDRWHKLQGWAEIGYHWVVRLDGTIEKGRSEKIAGAHCKGHNAHSIGICYIGGCEAHSQNPKDTRTPAQRAALISLLKELRTRYPGATIHGHRDYAAKACPSFDAAKEYAELNP